MAARILVADDHAVVRKGLCALVDEQPDMKIVAEAADGREAVELARELSPDVVIMDVGMPELNGMLATKQIVEELPDVKVLGLSIHHDWQFVSKMLQAGAKGYVLKSEAAESLTDAIRTVLRGEVHLCPKAAHSVIKDYVRRVASQNGEDDALLTDREQEVLQLVAEGKTARDIGALLHLSARTVEGHRQRIMYKLGTHNTAELIKYAIREGLTPLDS